MARNKNSGATGSKVSSYRPGHHPNSVAALAEHGIRPGEVRNPRGLNGRSTRKIREAFAQVLEQDVGDGQQLLDLLVERAVEFARKGTSRELFQLLNYVSPPTQRIDGEVSPSPELEDAIEELRRRGPYCLEPFTTEAECVEAAPDDQ
jgi:hypothetical protein